MFDRQSLDSLAKRLTNRVQLTSDGHKAYLDAVERAFGSDIDYAMNSSQESTTCEIRLKWLLMGFPMLHERPIRLTLKGKCNFYLPYTSAKSLIQWWARQGLNL